MEVHCRDTPRSRWVHVSQRSSSVDAFWGAQAAGHSKTTLTTRARTHTGNTTMGAALNVIRIHSGLHELLFAPRSRSGYCSLLSSPPSSSSTTTTSTSCRCETRHSRTTNRRQPKHNDKHRQPQAAAPRHHARKRNARKGQNAATETLRAVGGANVPPPPPPPAFCWGGAGVPAGASPSLIFLTPAILNTLWPGICVCVGGGVHTRAPFAQGSLPQRMSRKDKRKEYEAEHAEAITGEEPDEHK